MSKQLKHKLDNRIRRKKRIRSSISGTSQRPRLSVHISNLNVSAQLIDDEKGHTLLYKTTVGKKTINGNMTEKARIIGQEVGSQAKSKKIKRVVFDRNAKKYHGRVAALAEAARKEGLEF